MAQHRHKRETNARLRAFKPRAVMVAAPLAVLATAPAVAVGVLHATPPNLARPQPTETLMAAANLSAETSLGDRSDIVSRSFSRAAAQATAAQKQRKATQKATQKAVAQADDKLWTTTELNVWSGAGGQADKRGVLDAGKHVLVTGRKDDGRVEIVLDGAARWVTAGYLSDDKPIEGIGGECTNGTTVASGVSPNIAKVHTAVCARFPSVSTYGTLRGGGGDHPLGRAVDIMVSGALGWDIANFVRANAGALGVSYVIYAQHIWSVERSGEGWRGMSNRGSITANHFDHVHVSTY